MSCGVDLYAARRIAWLQPGRLWRALGTTAWLIAWAGLAGCGHTAAQQAAAQAGRISRAAAGLQQSAGDYRAAASFPIALAEPLSDMQLSAALARAKTSPSGYVTHRSRLGDLKEAQAMLAKGLAIPALPEQIKGVLAAQKAFVELAAAQRHLQRMLRVDRRVQPQLAALQRTCLQVRADARRIGILRNLRRSYARAGVKQLAWARQAVIQEKAQVQAAGQRVAALAKQRAAYIRRQTHYNRRGIALENAARLTRGAKALAIYKRAMAAMDQTARVTERVTRLGARWKLARQNWQAARRRLRAAKRQVRQLTALREASLRLAREEGLRIAGMQAAVKALVSGPLTVGGVSVNHCLHGVYAGVDRSAKEGQKALALCASARQDLGIAVQQQGRTYALARRFVAQGLLADDPLAMAYSSHNPACLLQLYRAYAGIRAAQIGQMLLWNLRLQQAATAAVPPAYAALKETAPTTAPAGDLARVRQAALAALQKAAADLKQAQGLLGTGHSPVHWLTPALGYEMAETQAAVTTDPSQRASALAAAAQYAATARKLNPFLLSRLNFFRKNAG